jgi:hypothetical protein
MAPHLSLATTLEIAVCQRALVKRGQARNADEASGGHRRLAHDTRRDTAVIIVFARFAFANALDGSSECVGQRSIRTERLHMRHQSESDRRCYGGQRAREENRCLAPVHCRRDSVLAFRADNSGVRALVSDAVLDCSRRGEIMLDAFLGNLGGSLCPRVRGATTTSATKKPPVHSIWKKGNPETCPAVEKQK